jgi:small subunit ribosomal protein S6
MRLSEDVIRYLTVKQDGPMPAPRSLPSSPADGSGTSSEQAIAAGTES